MPCKIKFLFIKSCLIGPGEFFAEESFLLENEREFAIKLNPVIIHGPHSKA